ncbi:MAG: type II secretion system F family protein [Acidobacteria bacterium]|nr:type II secretion system F family protein [Acidobacteriota bacterium]
MPEYVARLANERGEVLKRVESAASENELRDRYAQQGFFIYSIRRRASVGGLAKTAPAKKKVKVAEFLTFNQQFVTLIRAGLPIVKSLELLSGQLAHPSLRIIIQEVRESVKSGSLLSEAFRAQGIFPEIYTTSLMAGEKSGNLEEVLERYIQYQRMALSVKKRLIASLVYPALLVAMVLIMVTFLVTYVIPNFAELYRSMARDLPPLTRGLIAFTDAFKKYQIALMILVVGTVVGVLIWRSTEKGAESLDRLKMNLPLVGMIWIKHQVAQFSRILATLLSGGIPVVQALETAGQSVTSPLLRHSLDSAGRQVREGRPLSQGLSDSGFFPELAIEMVQVGESSGALPQMLSSVADFYEEDVSTSLAAMLTLIEPAILIIMGVVVATVLIALYLPIFSLAGRV